LGFAHTSLGELTALHRPSIAACKGREEEMAGERKGRVGKGRKGRDEEREPSHFEMP